tara:strand:- start:1940 stop:2908 length:969 start_codon:yes stop_codon:yes gene_type:complete
MAVTSTIEYCTDRQVQDVYPNLSQHDMKRRIYNWVDQGSNEYIAYNTGLVTVLYADGNEFPAAEGSEADVVEADDWYYDSGEDYVRVYHATNPNNMIMEAGDDWANIKERMRRKASRLIESRLDYRMAREVVKDREGNYPEIIIHATAIQAVLLHLKSSDPNNDIIEPFQNDLNEIVEGLSTGKIVLPTAISVDSSKGVIREVDVDAASDLRPVELRGNYTGTGYELLKVKIESSENGVIGTTKMTVYGKSSTTMKAETLIDSEIITGDFQSLGAGNLYIRWGGDNVVDAITTADDEYEIELWGDALDSSVPSAWSVEASRR